MRYPDSNVTGTAVKGYQESGNVIVKLSSAVKRLPSSRYRST